MNFKEFWKSQYVRKALTQGDLSSIRGKIGRMEGKGKPAKAIISALQSKPEIKDRWKAERAYWTETKKLETNSILQSAEDLDITKFKIIPSPSACPLCLKVSGDGEKVFDRGDLLFKGNQIPPVHPNCYCILIPA